MKCIHDSNIPQRQTLNINPVRFRRYCKGNCIRTKNNTQSLFLKTRPAVAVFLAGVFLAPPPNPLIVLITVFFGGGATFFATGTGFRTMVVLLPSLEALAALPRPTRGCAGGAGVRLPRPIPPAPGVSAPFRTCAGPLLAFAFSTMFVKMPAGPPGGAGGSGLRGETGRESCAFPGIACRIGEPGSVRELADRGERTWDAGTLFLEVVRSPGIGPLARFLGLSISSFSLSVIISPLLS